MQMNPQEQSMSAQDYRKAVEQYIDALNAADLERILDIYAEDAAVEDPVGSAPYRGKQAISDFYAQGAINSGLRATLTGPVRIAGREAAFSFYVDIEMDGNKMRIEPIDVFRFNEAGKVESMRAFWGPENMS
jgi:steroid delta-isomerase